ncbi:endospore germination permease [Clostridium sp. MB40-C1]|uniref:GerAB/ArcD/ProY family transporter n=1 Tax=Clostridium sp. MB40-C1 TaxID=3070996 RepID=UPI0027E1812F|nr:endospore germination permease [Clostridium sp. MB40-C1]WMJ79703.1 endospore germination permease [Clostridium sp. MB40-C1]
MDNRRIVSNYDLFVSIVVTVVGTSIFSYPAELSKVIGTDGWIVILLTSVLVVILLYLLNKALKANNYNRLLDVLYDNFGNLFGKVIAIIFVCASIISISLQMRIFVEVTKMYLLEKTPTEFILLLMILTGTFLIRGELESVIRFNEIAFWLMFIPILLVIPFVLNGGDYTNILPVFNHEPLQYIKACKLGLFGFLGFGISYMLFPYVKDKKSIYKITFRSITFITIFYIIINMASLVMFSKEYNSELLWPSISMISVVDIPGTFIERWEGLAMIFWLIFYFTTYVNLYYFSSEIIRDVFHLEDVKISLMFIVPLIYIIALYPENVAEVYMIQKKIFPYIDIFIVGVIPILLLIIAFFKTRRVKNES